VGDFLTCNKKKKKEILS
jgi:hypothetical protein